MFARTGQAYASGSAGPDRCLSERWVVDFADPGGASGIGLALASRFLAAGSRVIVCGRREPALRDAAAAHPGLVTRVCNLAREEDRAELVEWPVREHPALNVLVNNAGIQRRIRLDQPEPWSETREELAINLDAPIHLALALLPHFRERGGAIVNVTGLHTPARPRRTRPLTRSSRA